jgi:hypothetical protein
MSPLETYLGNQLPLQGAAAALPRQLPQLAHAAYLLEPLQTLLGDRRSGTKRVEVPCQRVEG